MSDEKPVMDGSIVEPAKGYPEPHAEEKAAQSSSIEPQESNEPKVVYRGLRDIHSEEDLVQYTKELEEKVVRATLSSPQTAQALQPPPVIAADESVEEKELQEAWYSDPTKAVKILEKRFERQTALREGQKENQATFWTKFYEKNPDLNRHRQVVDLFVAAKDSVLRPMPVEKAEATIAAEVRKMVGQVRNGVGATETALESKAAVMTGASSEPAPRTATAQAKPVTFSEQIKSLRRHKRVS